MKIWFNKPLRDELLIINDDREARAVAAFYGLGKSVAPENWEPGPVGSFHYLGSSKHPSHWIVIGEFWGYFDRADNGWIAYFIPKGASPDPDAAEAEFRAGHDLPPAEPGHSMFADEDDGPR